MRDALTPLAKELLASFAFQDILAIHAELFLAAVAKLNNSAILAKGIAALGTQPDTQAVLLVGETLAEDVPAVVAKPELLAVLAKGLLTNVAHQDNFAIQASAELLLATVA